MKRPRQHEIDEEAENLFQSLLPSSWVKNPYGKGRDYAKDFDIEIAEGGELTGIRFVAQVKGCERFTRAIKSPSVRFGVETKYLEYYADKARDAVFCLLLMLGKRRESGRSFNATSTNISWEIFGDEVPR